MTTRHDETELSATGLLRAVNDTETVYPRNATIHELFLQRAEETPDHPAVVTRDTTCTYRQLQERSLRLAHRITSAGVRPGEMVAVHAGRGLDWIVASLAVLRAGGVYLPVSPSEPPKRFEYLLADSGARLVLREGDAEDDDASVIAIGADTSAEPGSPTGVAATDPAYLMYTSGSTGMPKGVLVSHRNVVRLVTGTTYVDFSPRMRVLQTGAVSFDAATFEVWGALLNGGTVVLVGNEEILDGGKLGAALREHEVTTMWLTSPLFSQLACHDPGLFAPLRELVVGGDVVVGEHVAAVLNACPGLCISNGYGPTENTTFSVVHRITLADTEGEIPIGRPIANSTAYILGPSGAPLPAGQTGELHVGGDGVALGYINRPELTEAAFRDDPYVPGGRMYRTGDLARWREDGIIEFLGRNDDQVKIRGFRIELGEIEAALRQHDLVKDAVVVPRRREEETRADRYLAGYVAVGDDLESYDLRGFLAARLPHYMIPGYLVVLEELPLTPHGKIDRQALPDPTGMYDLPSEYVPPRDDAEARVADIWERVLGISAPGVFDSLFDLGADSLDTTRLAAAVGEAFGCTVSASDIFGHPTLAEMAALASSLAQTVDDVPVASTTVPPGGFPLSPQQRAIYVEQRKDEQSVRYNVPILLEIDPRTDTVRLEAAWRELVARHEALRTEFSFVDEPIQQVADAVELSLEVQDHAPRLDALVRPFDMGSAPLLRTSVHRAEGRCWLFADMHHLIVDGTSLAQMFRELDALYRGDEPPPPPHQYRDYIQWTLGLGRAAHDTHREHWENVFSLPQAQAELPTDHPRPQVRSNAGGLLRIPFGAERTAALRALAAGQGTTVFTVLAALHSVFLCMATSAEDVTVGVPAAGRASGFETTAGMFVNTVCLRTNPVLSRPFTGFLGEVSRGARDAFAHQGFPFEELARMIAPNRTAGRNPIFDTMIAFQQRALLDVEFLGEHVQVRPGHTGQTMFDLNLQVYEGADSLDAEWEYALDLFDPETVVTFGNLLLRLTDQALATPSAPISRLIAEASDPGAQETDLPDLDFEL